MNLFQQLSAATGKTEHKPQAPVQTLYGQLVLASQESRKRHNNRREFADAAWMKAFNGETITIQQLASRRHLQRKATAIALKRLVASGLVERAGTSQITGERSAMLWRWVDEASR